MKIPLFDIDGTLLTGENKVHIDSFDYALKTVYKQPIASINEINPHGMIDTQILMEVLKLHGVSETKAKEKLHEAMDVMVNYCETHKETGKHILLDGVLDILNLLKKKDVPMGLLTGNVEKIGWAKMESVGIKDYFTFGAFGSLAFKRVDLIKIAQKRLESITNTSISLNNFVIIGDTPLDIACARAGNIEVIAVSTGNYSIRDLKKLNPDLAIKSLQEKEKILEFLQVI